MPNPFIRNHTAADCTLINLASGRCVELAHRCPDCAAHVLPAYNAAGELLDHDCPSPSSID